MTDWFGRIARVAALLVALVLILLPARAVADSDNSRSPISVGGGVGFVQLLHIDASYWVTERVTVDVRAWSFVFLASGVDGHVTYRVPFSRTGSFLLQAGGGWAAEVGHYNSRSLQATIGYGYLGSSLDFRFNFGLMHLESDTGGGRLPTATITFMKRW